MHKLTTLGKKNSLEELEKTTATKQWKMSRFLGLLDYKIKINKFWYPECEDRENSEIEINVTRNWTEQGVYCHEMGRVLKQYCDDAADRLEGHLDPMTPIQYQMAEQQYWISAGQLDNRENEERLAERIKLVESDESTKDQALTKLQAEVTRLQKEKEMTSTIPRRNAGSSSPRAVCLNVLPHHVVTAAMQNTEGNSAELPTTLGSDNTVARQVIHVTKHTSSHNRSLMKALNARSIEELQNDIDVCQKMDEHMELASRFSQSMLMLLDVHFAERFGETEFAIEGSSSWLARDPRLIVNELKRLLAANTGETGLTELSLAEQAIRRLPGFEKGLDFNTHEMNLKYLMDIQEVIDRHIGEEKRRDKDERTLKPLRNVILNKIRDCTVFGKAVYDQFVARQLEDFSWPVVFAALYKEYTNAMQYVEKARVFLPKEVFNRSRYVAPPWKKEPTKLDTSVEPSPWKKPRQEQRANKNPRLDNQTKSPPKIPYGKNGKDKSMTCYGCGRAGHNSGQCVFNGRTGHPKHPDYNDTNTPWVESVPGKAWFSKDLNCKVLPTRQTLNGAPYVPPAFPKPGKGKEICTLCNLNNVVPVCITEPIKLGKYGMREMFISPLINNALPLRVEVLLDTGSIGEEANFISREVAKSLRLVGYNGRKVSKKVCSCFNNNLHSITESFKLKITFYDDNKVLKTVVILADVIDSVHDVIIGYKDIMKKQELRQLLLSDISNHTDNDGYLVSDPELDKFEFCGERSESGSSEYSTGWASSNVMKHKRNQKHRVNLVKRKSLRRQKCRRRHSTAKSNVSALRESEVQILRLDGPIELQSGIRKVLRDFSRVFSNELNKEPALIRPMDIEFHEGSVWKSNTNAGPPRMQSKLKAEDIKVQVDTMLRSGVIEVSKAVAYSQVMLTIRKMVSGGFVSITADSI